MSEGQVDANSSCWTPEPSPLIVSHHLLQVLGKAPPSPTPEGSSLERELNSWSSRCLSTPFNLAALGRWNDASAISRLRKNDGGTSSFLGGIRPRREPEGSSLLRGSVVPPPVQKSALVSRSSLQAGFTPGAVPLPPR